MKMDYGSAERLCRQEFERGASLAEIVLKLHSSGIGILDSIKAIRNACGISLGEAKRIVTSHPVWTSEVARNESLHDAAQEIIQTFDEPQ